MTRRFVSAKRLIRYFSNSSKLVEHRTQSPAREVKMLAVCTSILGNPSAIEGQTANILTSRTGLWARCSTSLLEIEKYLIRRLAETKRSIIPATYWHIYLFIYLLFIFIYLFITCTTTKNTCGSLSISSSRGGRRLPLWSVWWLEWCKRKTFCQLVLPHSLPK